MARQVVAVALLFIVAFAAVVSGQNISPSSSPTTSATPKTTSPPTPATIADDDGEPPVPSDEPATSSAAPTPANSAPADANPSDKPATDDANNSAASLKISTTIGATAAAGFFFM